MPRLYSSRPNRRTFENGPEEWSRRRLVAVLAAVGLATVSVLAGAGWMMVDVLTAPHPPSPSVSGSEPVTVLPGGGVDPRDELAERPFPQLPLSAARPGPLTTRRFAELRLPPATRLGPAGVSTGYPQTPAGAVAQLASIDQAALQSASVPGAQAVIAGWAVPGGPTSESWSGVRAIAEMLDAAGVTGGHADGGLLVSASPELALIKGTVGDDYAVVCVNFVVTATLTSTARTAAADCQRMVWVPDTAQETPGDGRWMIGPGPEPAQAPSVWPGTQAAHDLGYQVLLP
jgi:hypothetical protein